MNCKQNLSVLTSQEKALSQDNCSSSSRVSGLDDIDSEDEFEAFKRLEATTSYQISDY